MSQSVPSDETICTKLSDGYADELISPQMGSVSCALSQSLLLLYPHKLMDNRNRALLGGGHVFWLCRKSTYYYHPPHFIHILSY